MLNVLKVLNFNCGHSWDMGHRGKQGWKNKVIVLC